MWAEGVPADHGPGRAYLAGRWVWPGADVDGAPPLPAAAVRWLPRKAAAPIRDPRTGKGLWLPETAAGALLVAFTDAAGEVVAVQLEALTAAGERTPWTTPDGQPQQRYRRTRGRATGAYLRLSRSEGEARQLVIVEGPTDALAAFWLWMSSTVWGCAGTAGYRHLRPEDVAGFDPVVLAADGDLAGQEATWPAAKQLLEAGIRVKKWEGWDGADLVDSLSERLEERAAIVEYDGQLPRAEAEAIAWTPYLNPAERTVIVHLTNKITGRTVGTCGNDATSSWWFAGYTSSRQRSSAGRAFRETSKAGGKILFWTC